MKVAIYCRLSEEDHDKLHETDDSNSIKNQKAMLLQYAMEKGWDVYSIYSDDDYAGADRRRPEFNRLLIDAEQHKFNIVLCKSLSRFTREIEIVEKYIHGLFPEWGIRFVSVVDHTDTNVKGSKKIRQMNGLVNEWYLADMSDNIKASLNIRRKNGYHIGSFALYGYSKDPEQKGHLIIDEEAAKIVREVFSLFAKGHGKTSIARILNDRGIPNPTEYKRQNGLRYKTPASHNATLWRYSAISDMLTNEMYLGNMIQGKYGSISYKSKRNKPRDKSEWFVVEGTHDPIIDRETWDKVQTLVAGRAKPFKVGTIGLFAKKVRCASCGYFMRSSKSKGRLYLRCANRYISQDSCEGASISVDRLERIVVDELNRLSAEYMNKEELERKVEFVNNLEDQKSKINSDLAFWQKKLEKNTNAHYRIYQDRIYEEITESEYITFSNKNREEREQLEKSITEAERALAEIEEKIAAGDDRRARIDRYINVSKLTREIVEDLVDCIYVSKRDPGSKTLNVEIKWNL